MEGDRKIMGRIIGQIAGRVALILLAGLVVAGASYAVSRTPTAAALMRAVQRGRGDGPPPGAIPPGNGAPGGSTAQTRGTASTGTNPGRRGPANGTFAGGTAPAGANVGRGAPAGGAFLTRPGGEGRPGGGRPADPSRGLPEFGRDMATLAGVVLVAVLLGRVLALLATTMRARRRPAAV